MDRKGNRKIQKTYHIPAHPQARVGALKLMTQLALYEFGKYN